jgi:4-hydroxythreonine-4-phosphate dehydrogenase
MRAEPPLAITMGDPAGVGPEIVVKALAARPGRPALVLGDVGILRRAAAVTATELEIVAVDGPGRVVAAAGVVSVLALTALPADLPHGRLDAACGRASYRYVRRGAHLAADAQAAALITAPINKRALSLAGFHYPGHTEILAELGHVTRCAMMLVTPALRVVLVTVHLSLREAISALSEQREFETIALAHQAGVSLGHPHPRIAVAGLNPHAGEEGLFGSEERDIIAPAVRRARHEGIDASGPWAPDTVFMRARAGEFDLVVSQYHDQGLIPIKYLGIGHGVNVTLGLPYVRTSVDHGTAFDLAGSGCADERSMLAALDLAERLVEQRRGRSLCAHGQQGIHG